MNNLYAAVAVSISHSSVDRLFSYKVPDDLQDRIFIGMRVKVPFGASNKTIEAYIIELTAFCDVPTSKLKSIVSLIDNYPIFTPQMIALAKWMKTKYYSTLAECLQCIMPAGIKMKSDYLVFVKNILLESSLRGKTKEIFEFLKQSEKPILQSELNENFGNRVSVSLKTLVAKDLIAIKEISEVKDYALVVKYASFNFEYEKLEELHAFLDENPKETPQIRVIKLLLNYSALPVSEIKNLLNISDSPIKTLAKKGIIYFEEIEKRRSLFDFDNFEKSKPLALNEEQFNAVSSIKEVIANGGKQTVLVHGVTGSGKTEVYIQLVEDVIARGEQAIILVPEISLTSQTVERFIRRFGEMVSVTHSRLSLGERLDQWKKALAGEIKIMIGPRSAIFTPFSSLGIIIIDEEHENTYKSETTPKYHTKEVAQKICELSTNNCITILGSATPSVDTYFEAKKGTIKLIELKNRVNKTPPTINIVDMRTELEEGNRSIFSRALLREIETNLNNKEQTILFLNRRGHSTFVSCRRCGEVLTCDNCSVSYTYHLNNSNLVCHYCGKQMKMPTNCPVCDSSFIRHFGAGTEKVETSILKLFPHARVLRMDLDTTSKKFSHERILKQFASGEADILIGTQMIAKGHDFPNVSLVGIVAADLSLNMGDYRSSEITYQLISQVAGRAGRAEILGRAIIQTYSPENFSITCASTGNFSAFYHAEISIRERLNYPPFSNIFVILFTGINEKNIIVLIYKLINIMKAYNKKDQFEILGPSPALISKINKQYRWKLLVKCVDEEKLKSYVLYCIDKLKKNDDLTEIYLNLTLNPVMMY